MDTGEASRLMDPAKLWGPFAYLEIGRKGEPLLFLHANGYPPACYRPLLELFALKNRVLAPSLRPLWPGANPQDIQSWKAFSGDLLHFMAEQQIGPVVAAGHSLGAIVCLRAALMAPERFAGLILIEPVLYPPWKMLQWAVARASGLGYRFHPMIRRALNRRRRFGSLDDIFAAYRTRPIFRRLSDENLRTCIDGIVKPTEGGFELAYSPEWEARVYYTAVWNDWDLWRGIPLLRLPTLIIRGSDSETFPTSTAEAVRRRNSRIRIITLERGVALGTSRVSGRDCSALLPVLEGITRAVDGRAHE